MYEFNIKLYESIVKNTGIIYVDCNRILDRNDFTRHGLHFSTVGKTKLIKHILNIYNQSTVVCKTGVNGYINRRNLVYVVSTNALSSDINDAGSHINENSGSDKTSNNSANVDVLAGAGPRPSQHAKNIQCIHVDNFLM